MKGKITQCIQALMLQPNCMVLLKLHKANKWLSRRYMKKPPAETGLWPAWTAGLMVCNPRKPRTSSLARKTAFCAQPRSWQASINVEIMPPSGRQTDDSSLYLETDDPFISSLCKTCFTGVKSLATSATPFPFSFSQMSLSDHVQPNALYHDSSADSTM